jgi:hypothetical protein
MGLTLRRLRMSAVAGVGTGLLIATAGSGSAAVVTNTPAGAADNASTGTVAWTDPGKVGAADGAGATVTVGPDVVSHYLVATGYAFSLPTNALVDGIMAGVRRKSGGGTQRDAGVYLVRGGNPVGATHASRAKWPRNFNYANYGSATDRWGVAWSAADVNVGGFGLALAVQNPSSGNRKPVVDTMRLAVAYRVPPAVDNGAAPSNIVGTVVTVGGRVLAGEPSPVVYLYWGASDGGTNPAAWSHPLVIGQTNGTYSVTLTGLDAFTEYWYRSFASNSAGTAWAPESSVFETQGPGLSIGDVTVVEGNTGTTSAVFPVTLSATSSVPVTFSYITVPGTATEDSDYAAATGTITLLPGETATSVTVTVFGDVFSESSSEVFAVNLIAIANADLVDDVGVGTILDDDSPPVLQYSATPYAVAENAGSQCVTVVASGPFEAPVSVAFGTADGTALAGRDYEAVSGTLTWSAGDTNSKSFHVPILDNLALDGARSFSVHLSNAVNCTVAGSGVTNVTIADNEAVPSVDNEEGASAIGSRSAALNGTVSAGSPAPTVTVYYGPADGGESPSAWSTSVVVSATSGAFSVGISDLDPDSGFFYRCFASNAVGSAWAPASAEFYTLPLEVWIERITDVAGVVTVFWQGEAGWHYTLQAAESLSATAVWQAVSGGSNLVGVSENMSVTDGTATPCRARFYRVMAQ